MGIQFGIFLHTSPFPSLDGVPNQSIASMPVFPSEGRWKMEHASWTDVPFPFQMNNEVAEHLVGCPWKYF